MARQMGMSIKARKDLELQKPLQQTWPTRKNAAIVLAASAECWPRRVPTRMRRGVLETVGQTRAGKCRGQGTVRISGPRAGRSIRHREPPAKEPAAHQQASSRDRHGLETREIV